MAEVGGILSFSPRLGSLPRGCAALQGPDTTLGFHRGGEGAALTPTGEALGAALAV